MAYRVSTGSSKRDFWASEYAIPTFANSRMQREYSPEMTGHVAARWRREAEGAPLRPVIPPSMECPSPSKTVLASADLGVANNMLAREMLSHSHRGETPAHSCVLAITEARARSLEADAASQRMRLDSVNPFGRYAAIDTEHPYSSTSSYRGRLPPPPVLTYRFDRLPAYRPASQGSGGRGPGFTQSMFA